MKNIIQGIKAVLLRNGADNDDDVYASKSEARLAQILQEASSSDDGEEARGYVEVVNAFISTDDIQRRKVLSYCLDFFDPTDTPQQTSANGEQIQQHKFLQEDEFIKLYKFIKRHSADKTFGETVYKVMNSHGMTPPGVYKNAMLRRQDFARATDFRTKNVTRQIAWQIIIGLHCSLEEADEVLFSAGFIRRNSRLDLTMEYFIRQGNYDIMAINEVLGELEIKPFSCYKSVRDNDNK